jgi:hypothetical protein
MYQGFREIYRLHLHSWNCSESEPELLATGSLPPISSSRRQLPRDFGHHFFQPNSCGISPYVTSSLTIGCVYRLQLLLAFASTVILGSEFRERVIIFCCLIFETPSTWRARSPYLYPPGTGFPFRRLHTGFEIINIYRGEKTKSLYYTSILANIPVTR